MRTSSAKAKGRRLAAKAKEMLLLRTPELQDADFRVTPSGVTGPDLDLSPLAASFYPFVFEMKNQERIQIWQSLEQAESHKKETDRIPLLVFSRNHSEVYAALKFDDLLQIVKGLK